MKSKAVLFGHPAHPMLIPFPFAFLTGAFLFDAAGWWSETPAWWTTGGHLALAGIAAALVAAVPGLIDYLYTVPPRSSGKKRATQHMLANLTTVALFATAWLVRGDPAHGLDEGGAVGGIGMGQYVTHEGGKVVGGALDETPIGVAGEPGYEPQRGHAEVLPKPSEHGRAAVGAPEAVCRRPVGSVEHPGEIASVPGRQTDRAGTVASQEIGRDGELDG